MAHTHRATDLRSFPSQTMGVSRTIMVDPAYVAGKFPRESLGFSLALLPLSMVFGLEQIFLTSEQTRMAHTHGY